MEVCTPDMPDDRDFFDLTGALSNKGKTYLWRDLNRIIRAQETIKEEKLNKMQEPDFTNSNKEAKDQTQMGTTVHQPNRSSLNKNNARNWSLETAYHTFKNK